MALLPRRRWTNRLACAVWRQQQKNKERAGAITGASCNVYYFQSTNSDSLQLGSPFTGNLKVIIAATAETGLHPDIIAGRQGAFVASADPVNDPQWVQYEIEAVAIDWLLDTVFNGVVTYAKDNLWYQLDMGVPIEPPPVTGDYPWRTTFGWSI